MLHGEALYAELSGCIANLDRPGVDTHREISGSDENALESDVLVDLGGRIAPVDEPQQPKLYACTHFPEMICLLLMFV